MGRTWTEDGKRRQSLQLLFINSSFISIEDTKESRVPLASDAAFALRAFAGQYASLVFGLGHFGASLLAGAVLPLTTSYAICEAFGFERDVSRTFREAPVFQSLFTGMIILGVIIALIPGLPFV